MHAVILFISGSEIFIILLVVLLLFGANKLPEIARGLGKGMNEFKRATRDIRSEFDEQTRDIQNEVKGIKKDLEDQTRFNVNDGFFDDEPSASTSAKEDEADKTGKNEDSSSYDSPNQDTGKTGEDKEDQDPSSTKQ